MKHDNINLLQYWLQNRDFFSRSFFHFSASYFKYRSPKLLPLCKQAPQVPASWRQARKYLGDILCVHLCIPACSATQVMSNFSDLYHRILCRQISRHLSGLPYPPSEGFWPEIEYISPNMAGQILHHWATSTVCCCSKTLVLGNSTYKNGNTWITADKGTRVESGRTYCCLTSAWAAEHWVQ